MLTLERQEGYRRRYSALHPGWQPATLAYERRVAARLRAHTRVLDLGCGRGGVMERLHVHAGSVAGLDPDTRSLREHRAAGLLLVAGRGERLPFDDGRFDLVCCSWVLEHLPDPPAAFGEIARVLAPGGRFIFLTPQPAPPVGEAEPGSLAPAAAVGGGGRRFHGRDAADSGGGRV